MIPADRPRTRWMLLSVMTLGLFMNASLTHALTTSSWPFVVLFLVIQLGRTAWTIASVPDRIDEPRDPRARRAALTYGVVEYLTIRTASSVTSPSPTIASITGRNASIRSSSSTISMTSGRSVDISSSLAVWMRE